MPYAAPVHRRKAPGKRHRDKQSNRQSRRALNTNSKQWKAIRLEILLRDDYTCQQCARFGDQVDHKDGDDSNQDDDNLWTLCITCHSRKTRIEQNKAAGRAR